MGRKGTADVRDYGIIDELQRARIRRKCEYIISFRNYETVGIKI